MTGLTDKEVKINKELYGSNKIEADKTNSFWKLFLESLGDPIIRILIIALGIKVVFLMKNFDWYETVGIVVSILIASFISTISEYGSEQAFQRMQEDASKIKSKVIRNGKVCEISSEDIVVSDIVILNTGDRIPADGKIIEGSILVDESILSGESIEKEKNIGDEIYKGTVVYSKKCKMRVTNVGINTNYGRLSLELKKKSPSSPLKKRLTVLAGMIAKIGYICAILLVISYLFSNIVIANSFDFSKIFSMSFREVSWHILYALTLSVTLIVVVVPEGLPLMINLVLSSNMKRMLKDNVLVRKLVGIETSGNINILFTDKTGTLTKGKLEVVKFIDGNLKEYDSIDDVKFKDVLNESILYNVDSEFTKDGIVGGNSTDRALLNFIKRNPKTYQVINSIPFDSKNKFMETTILKNKEITYVKGAPEKILPMCHYYYDGSKRLLNISKVEKVIEEYTKKGIRVIAVGIKSERLFLGLLLLKDEIKMSAKESIAEVKKAGIDIVMITGDSKNTAYGIGKDLGMLDDDSIIIDSDELKKLSDNQIKEILPHLKIVARALPSDKSRLVKIAQELNLVVGMTGDGVNDAPALKLADVGFAMGSGTEVAKEASDIVILDDNFLSISKAILYGRTIFKSIRKFIVFQLSVNICAVSLSIIGPFIHIDTPITVIQMLWINMVMDTLAGLAFSYEPALKEYMLEKPKKESENIINKYMLNEILITGLYSTLICLIFLKVPFFKELFRPSGDDKYFMTAFFGLFIFISLFNSFNVRTKRLNIFYGIFKNKMFLAIMIFIVVVQLFLIYFGGTLFRTAGLTTFELLFIILLSLTIIPFDFLRKIIYKKIN